MNNSDIRTEDKADLDTKFDILGNLPREICYKILLYLKPQDVANSFACCKKWQRNINFNFVWEKIFRRVYTDSEEEPKSDVYHKFVQSFSAYWQGRFAYNRALQYNVENQKFGLVRINVNTKTPFRFVHMDDRMLILASEYNFFIINPSTGSVNKRIWFRNTGDLEAIKHGDHLIALTGGGHWKVWNVEDWSVVIDLHVREMENADLEIKVLAACKHLIIIVIDDDKVYIADIIKKNYVHFGPGIFACCNNDFIAILQNNGNIVLRDTDYYCVSAFRCPHMKDILNMQMNEYYLVLEYNNTEPNPALIFFDIIYRSIFIVDRWRGVLWPNCFQISGNKLVFRSMNYSTVGVWNMSTQEHLFNIDHRDIDSSINNNDVRVCVYRMMLRDNYIFVKYNFTIGWHVFCVKTGKLIRHLNYLPSNDANIEAITSSRLLCNWDYPRRRDEFWEIIDYEANLLQTIT